MSKMLFSHAPHMDLHDIYTFTRYSLSYNIYSLCRIFFFFDFINQKVAFKISKMETLKDKDNKQKDINRHKDTNREKRLIHPHSFIKRMPAC